MKQKVPALTITALMFVLLASMPARSETVQPAAPAPEEVSEEATLATSRALAGALGKRLVGALQAAIAEQGPVAAINVCRDLAPQIASELSRQSGARVGRTSRRYRNPANAPEPWQVMVLESYFADSVEKSERRVEYFVEREDGSTRYMQAIRLGGICATCHGRDIAPDVQDALRQHYPHDLARGYAQGDLRGAFTVTWPGDG